MKRLLLIALAVLPILVGCSGGEEVKSTQIDDYQSAGRTPGDPVQKASAGGDSSER